MIYIYLYCVQCPVYDLQQNVKFGNLYQTVTTKGAIRVSVNSLLIIAKLLFLHYTHIDGVYKRLCIFFI